MKTMSNKKIKIGFVNYSLNIGGIENLILEICKRLNRNIFEPCIFVFEKDGNLKNEYINSQIAVFEVRKNEGFDWHLPLRLLRLFKKQRIDIVHTHNPANWLYGGIAARLAGIPLIHTEHSSHHHNYHTKRWELIEGILSKFTNSITAVSESVKNLMVEKSRITPSKIKVIYNAVNIENFKIEIDRVKLREALSLKEGDLVVGNVARFYDDKDHETLLKAFKLLLEEVKNAYLILIGDGPMKEKMDYLAKDLKIKNNVKFLGDRRDVPAFLKIMDLFVLSSKREGLPMVLLEAMAAGLPVVATNVDGNVELVIHNETGLLVPPGDARFLCDAMAQLLVNRDKAKRMGHNGMCRVREHFAFTCMVKQYEDIYKELL